MKLLSQTLAVGLIAILLVGCLDNDNATKVKEKENLQGLSSLEGTVWVHHPDTDTSLQSNGWFHLGHNPSRQWDGKDDNNSSYPIEISFLADGKIFEPQSIWLQPIGVQYYIYDYTEPYITIVLDIGINDCKSVAEWQKKYNMRLCPLTIDDYKCDPLKCNPINNPSAYCECASYYWFLGKVYGDTMHLQKILISQIPGQDDWIYRDIYLIRTK